MIRKPKRKPLGLIPVNIGIEAYYAKTLRRLINEMENSVQYWIAAAFNKEKPSVRALIAQDGAQPKMASRRLERACNKLAAFWQDKFNTVAAGLAGYSARATARQTDQSLKRLLKKAGWTVDFKLTRVQRDAIVAIVNENVSLIKSLPEQTMTQVRGLVMRSVAAGYDQTIIAKGLTEQFGVTKRRAHTIAHEQTKQAQAQLMRVRQIELGIQECEWFHSHGGRKPRPTHVAFGKDHSIYDPRKGMWDPDAHGKGKGAWVIPGQLINCRCMGRIILPLIGERFKAEAA